MSPDQEIGAAIGALARALSRCGLDFMIIGGIAVIARGVVRDTDDVDATVWSAALDLPALAAALREEGIAARIADAEQFARRHSVLLVRHEPTGVDVDLSLALLPFEREALDRAERLDLGGVRVPVALAEDLIVYKAVAWRDEDRQDIERLLRLHAGAVDLARVRRLVAEFAEALEEPERVSGFERLVERALRG
jgi:predicted nucleotidyltransferase